MKETLMTRRRARVAAAGVTLALLATLVACGDDPSDEGEPAGGGTTAAESSEEGAESTEAPVTTEGAASTSAASTSAAASSTSGAAGTSTTVDEAGAPPEVTVIDFAFLPEELQVAAGTEVTWTNEDDFAHQIVATDSENPFAGEGEIDTDETYSVTFAEVGTYDYFCGIHNSMTGSVVVV
jgi:plastocyanin